MYMPTFEEIPKHASSRWHQSLGNTCQHTLPWPMHMSEIWIQLVCLSLKVVLLISVDVFYEIRENVAIVKILIYKHNITSNIKWASPFFSTFRHISNKSGSHLLRYTVLPKTQNKKNLTQVPLTGLFWTFWQCRPVFISRQDLISCHSSLGTCDIVWYGL